MTTTRNRWVIDLGNSRLKCAPLDSEGAIGEVFAIGHEHPDPVTTLLRHTGKVTPDDEVWLASVASAERSTAVSQAFHSLGVPVRRIRSRAHFGRLRIAYLEAAQLGVDRFLALLAASERKDGPWVIVSAGSALTIDLLADTGKHLGGAIVPMPSHMVAALAANFTQLDLPVGKARELFADNTADAIATGALLAVQGSVERVVRKARGTFGVAPTLLLTGGNADLFNDVGYEKVVNAPSLVLEGMAQFVRGMER